MLGRKENVITGHSIPAGLRNFENMIAGRKEEYEKLQRSRSES
jgi:hypothetical protein